MTIVVATSINKPQRNLGQNLQISRQPRSGFAYPRFQHLVPARHECCHYSPSISISHCQGISIRNSGTSSHNCTYITFDNTGRAICDTSSGDIHRFLCIRSLGVFAQRHMHKICIKLPANFLNLPVNILCARIEVAFAGNDTNCLYWTSREPDPGARTRNKRNIWKGLPNPLYMTRGPHPR